MQVTSKFSVVFTEDMNRDLEEEVTKDEISTALSSMQNGKSPSPDGIIG
jgi:hypothetical protein